MRSLVATLLFAVTASCAFGDTDLTPHLSPDGRYAIYNVGDTADVSHHFEIRHRTGEVLFTSGAQDHLQGWTPTFAEDIRWSPDGRFVLLRYRDGKYDATALYALTERKLLDLSHVTDGWTVPVRWAGARSFVVEESGPHGGRALGGGYRRRVTYRIRPYPLHLECVHTGPTTTEPVVPYAPPNP